MKRKTTNKIISLLILMVLVIVTLAACGNRQKEIVISKDVKKDIKDEERTTLKLEKIKEFSLKNYVPICWKDDENIILSMGDSKEYSIDKANIENINFYSLNNKTLKYSKVATLSNAICGDIGKGSLNGVIIFLRNNKLCTYDFNNNISKERYDLTEILNELKKDDSKITDNKELLSKIHIGFVKGSDRYIYILDSWKGADYNNAGFLSGGTNTILRILDMKTDKVYKSPNYQGYFPYSDKNEFTCSFAYSKAKDSFFISSRSYNVIYRYSINDPTDLKKITTIAGEFCGVSEDGNDLYMSTTLYQKGTGSIVKYNIDEDKVTEIIGDKSNNVNGYVDKWYTGINFDASKGLISYSPVNYIYDTAGHLTNSSISSFIGRFNGKTINNAKMFPVKHSGNKFIAQALINPKGNMTVYSIIYYNVNMKTKKISTDKVNNYIYEIKK